MLESRKMLTVLNTEFQNIRSPRMATKLSSPTKGPWPLRRSHSKSETFRV